MDKYHILSEIKFYNGKMDISIDKKQYTFELNKISKKLANATKDEIQKYEISPSGYGIHWPLIDEDISIDGLLGIKHSSPKFKKPA